MFTQKPLEVARFAIDNGSNEYLQVLRAPDAKHNADLWEFPGGQWDAALDRDLTDTGVREAGQETGLKIEPITPPEVVYEYPMRGGSQEGRKHRTAIGLARLIGGSLRLDPTEVVDVRWLPLDKIATAPDTVEASRIGAQLLRQTLLTA